MKASPLKWNVCLLTVLYFFSVNPKAFSANLNLEAPTAALDSDIASSPLYRQGLLNENAQTVIKDLSQTYKQRNTINSAFLNLFPADNRAEVLQTRLGLEETRLAHAELRIFDILGQSPVAWNGTATLADGGMGSFHSVLAIDVKNIQDPRAPVVLIFGSNTHNLQSFLNLGLMAQLSSWGMIPVAFEYPGYGGSFGVPSQATWDGAGVGALKFLHQVFGRKIYVLGHSIGGAVAFEVAASQPELTAGVIAHATFYSLTEMGKDQVKLGPRFVGNIPNPLIVRVMARRNLFRSGPAIGILAQNDVPLLVLHGSRDGSVPPRHYAMITSRMAQAEARYRNTHFSSKLFGSTHEEIFSFEGYGEFDAIWASIREFIGH